jgi:hypothetical protein
MREQLSSTAASVGMRELRSTAASYARAAQEYSCRPPFVRCCWPPVSGAEEERAARRTPERKLTARILRTRRLGRFLDLP